MATRDSLLDVTARLYAEHGWRGTTTRRIAQAAGVNEVTVFRLFGSKARLLGAAITQAARQDQASPLPAVPGNLRRELAAWCAAQHRAVVAKSGLMRTALAEREDHPALAPQVCAGGARAFAALVRYLRAARRRGAIGSRGSIDAAATMLLNAIFMDAMTRDVIPGPARSSPKKWIDAFVDVVLRGLGAGGTA